MLRLIPRRADSQKVKRNVKTVSVKLRKAKNTLRNRYAEVNFTYVMKRQMRDIVFLFGSNNLFVLSVDDKAKVPTGVTAVTKQASIIMYISYESH